MSSDIGNALGWSGIEALGPDDKRAQEDDYSAGDDCFQPDPLANYWMRADLFYGTPSFRTPWWPANGWLLGDAGDINALDEAPWWGDPWGNCPGGTASRLAFVGITRDQNGTPLAGCTVRCFRAATNELESTVTSDANGFYVATTPYGDAHFLTVHNDTVSPPVGGATIDTLTPG